MTTGPRPRRLAAGWALPLLLAGGCASYRPTETGFLSSYEAMLPDRFHVNHGVGLQRAETFEAAADDLSAIDSYYVEPVEWRVDPTSRGGRDAWRRDWLCAYLEKSLRDQLGATKPVVDRPGPRTARVRSAITVVRLSRPVSNVVLTATLVSPYGIGPVFFGGGAVEAEVIGPDGRQVAAASTASGGGWLDLWGYYTKSDHARKAMDRCAGELVEAVAPSARELAARVDAASAARPVD